LSPIITKTKMELKPLWREIPRLEHLKLTQTPKTIVTCRVCRGSVSGGVVAVESSVYNTYTFKKCLLCKGTGVMSNDAGTYDRR